MVPRVEEALSVAWWGRLKETHGARRGGRGEWFRNGATPGPTLGQGATATFSRRSARPRAGHLARHVGDRVSHLRNGRDVDHHNPARDDHLDIDDHHHTARHDHDE